jgi:hypothetical protein
MQRKKCLNVAHKNSFSPTAGVGGIGWVHGGYPPMRYSPKQKGLYPNIATKRQKGKVLLLSNIYILSITNTQQPTQKEGLG